MKLLPQSKFRITLLVILLVVLIYTPIALSAYFFMKTQQKKYDSLQMSYSEVKQAQENFQLNLSEELFNEHLSLMEKQNLESQLSELESQIETIKNTPEGSLVANINQTFELYEDFGAKVKRNENAKLDTEEAVKNLEEWGIMLIEQKFDELAEKISLSIEELDSDYKDYLATLPPPAPAASTGYSYTTVGTEKGSFGVHLIKVPLSGVRVKTASAYSDDCKNDCPTKSLQQFVSDNGGFAGMNGSYFCPPDYSACGGKVNSFDYAFYHSGSGKWLHKDALSWFKTGLITFKGNSYNFYKKSSEYGGGSVDAGISNYPSLLKNGEVVVNDGDLTSFQKIKGTRGAIGVGDDNLYLAIIYNATVNEAAYAMRALGAKHALNLDGGGSSAMYVDGRYVVGPGRSLPNAIILVR